MWQGKRFRFTVIAAAVAATAAAAQAQESAGALEKVTVTATKREAVLTDVSLGISSLSDKALEARGHQLMLAPPGTSAHSILIAPGRLTGAADTRTRGSLAVGY